MDRWMDEIEGRTDGWMDGPTDPVDIKFKFICSKHKNALFTL